jgi:predicted ester cyclase
VLDAITTDDFVAHAPGSSGAKRDREAYKRVLHWYHETFRDPRWQIEDVIEADDTLVVRCRGTTTYTGGWIDLPRSDQRVTETCIMMFKLRDDLIRELWFEVSDLDLAMQLGGRVVVDSEDKANG